MVLLLHEEGFQLHVLAPSQCRKMIENIYIYIWKQFITSWHEHPPLCHTDSLKDDNLGPIPQRIYELIIQILWHTCCSYMNNNKHIRSQFCTWHDNSWHVRNSWPGGIIRIKLEQRMFTILESWAFVKRIPDVVRRELQLRITIIHHPYHPCVKQTIFSAITRFSLCVCVCVCVCGGGGV